MRVVMVLVIGMLGGGVIAAQLGFAARSRLAGWHLGRPEQGSNASVRAHTEETFEFTARAPREKVAPLLGANQERLWAPDWNPQFLYPMPATDVPGMVFTVSHPHVKSVWVNTQFDLENGRVQYAYVIPDTLVTVVTLTLTQQNAQTRVQVKYERTALSEKADAQVRQLAEHDRAAGPEWEKQVNAYVEGHKE